MKTALTKLLPVTLVVGWHFAGPGLGLALGADQEPDPTQTAAEAKEAIGFFITCVGSAAVVLLLIFWFLFQMDRKSYKAEKERRLRKSLERAARYGTPVPEPADAPPAEGTWTTFSPEKFKLPD